jgi:hypothetical protein
VAICCVGLSLYLMLAKENHDKTKENRIEKWGWTNTNGEK